MHSNYLLIKQLVNFIEIYMGEIFDNCSNDEPIVFFQETPIKLARDCTVTVCNIFKYTCLWQDIGVICQTVGQSCRTMVNAAGDGWSVAKERNNNGIGHWPLLCDKLASDSNAPWCGTHLISCLEGFISSWISFDCHTSLKQYIIYRYLQMQ